MNKRKMSYVFMVCVVFGCGLNAAWCTASALEVGTVHMANGIKIGEVTKRSVIIWTRLTKQAERNIEGMAFPENVNQARRSLPVKDLDAMEGSVPGAVGEVRVAYWPAGEKGKRKLTAWVGVDAKKDFTHQFQLKELASNTRYLVAVEGRVLGGETSCVVDGRFRTAPDSDVAQRITFSVVTGQDYPRRDDQANGHKIYSEMQKLDLDFFVHTGDIEYYDKPGPYADTVPLARFKWNRIFSLPFQRSFHNRTASYFIKDDHDTLKNDCWPGQNYGELTWDEGLSIYREQVPMGGKTYRTIRWGKDLQVWFVEGRDFRSANNMPDGPEKTIWGNAQKRWFFESVKASDATFRILISPTPIVGPDRGGKNDNHANKGFTHEGNEIRKFIGEQDDMYIVCGDRHWQYVSVDPVTGVKEFSCGPTTDVHARGFSIKNKSEMHRYLKIKGGFLSVTVERIEGVPVARFRHHGVDGSVYHEEVIHLEKSEIKSNQSGAL